MFDLDFVIQVIFFAILFCSITIILSANAVHSILLLVLVFILASFIFVILGAEYLALLLIIVYVGAVSILFLFVIMMLNLRISELHFKFHRYLPIGSFVGLYFLVIVLILLSQEMSLYSIHSWIDEYNDFIWFDLVLAKENIYQLGVVLYNHNSFYIVIMGLILFTAMVGCIVLTVDLKIRGNNDNKIINKIYSKNKNINLWDTKR